MLSISTRKRTYAKRINISKFFILHTVKYLVNQARNTVHFTVYSIYKSLTKNYLVLFCYFLSAKVNPFHLNWPNFSKQFNLPLFYVLSDKK